MSDDQPAAQVPAAAVQTPQAVSSCEVCGAPLGSRALSPNAPQRACSSKCRAIRWRRQRDHAIVAHLEAARRLVEGRR